MRFYGVDKMNKQIDPRVINYRRCSGRYFVRERGFVEFKLGYFHKWGLDSEEADNGALNYTIGIVELPSGQVVTVMPENIRFLDIN